MKSFKNLLAASAIASFSMSANAVGVTTFSDYASFAAAAGGPLSFESFEDYPSNPNFAPTQVFDYFSVSEINDAGDNVIKNSFTGAHDSSVVDGNDSIYSFNNGGASTVFDAFIAPTFAFGGYITSSKDTLVSYAVNGVSSTFSLGADVPAFFGVVDTTTAFNDITFTTKESDLLFGFDAVSVSAVPEASTLAMMAGGLGLVGFMAARRRKQA